MSSYNTLLSTVSFRYNDKVLKSCRPLFDHFNLNECWYYKVSEQGHFSYLGSHVAFDEYFSSEKLYLDYPYFRSPRNFQDGIILMDSVQDKTISKVVGKGKEHGLYHSMHLISKIPGGMEVFGFSSASSSNEQLAILFSEMPLIKLFIQKFKEENFQLLSKLEDNQIDLAQLIGPSFYEKQEPKMLRFKSRKRFLEAMGIECLLSLREKEVAMSLLNGLSARKIAAQLFLSTRTVEHHIERIKIKLNCDAKVDLVQKARELQELGLLAL